jgi:hypothetical protein
MEKTTFNIGLYIKDFSIYIRKKGLDCPFNICTVVVLYFKTIPLLQYLLGLGTFIRWYLSYILTVNFIDGENHQPTENHKLYNIKLYQVHLATAG